MSGIFARMLLILESQPVFLSALARIARLAKRGLQIEVTSDPKVYRQKLCRAKAAVVDVDSAGLGDLRQVPTLAVGSGAGHTVGASTVRAGARGYLNRCRATDDDVRLAMINLLDGRAALSEGVADGLLQIKESYKLSGRELEVAQGMVQGLNGNQIARKLALSRSAIQCYEGRLHEKLNTSSRLELVQQLTLILKTPTN